MKPQRKCKLCSLYKTHPDLWQEIHQKVISEGLSHSEVVKWLNLRIAVLSVDGEALPKFNASNFHNHFSSHLDEATDALKALRNEMVSLPNRGDSTYQVEQLQAAEATIDQLKEVSEHQELEKLIASCARAVVRYSETVDQKSNSSPNTIAAYQDMISNLLSMRKELSALKTVERVAQQAVEAAIYYMVVHVINQSNATAERVKDVLKQALPHSSIPDQVVNLIRKDIGDSLKSIRKNLIQKIREEYGIK